MNPGKTLQDFRKLHGLTQSDLAAFMFVHPATIGTWERNECKLTVENFEKLMNYMGYEIVIRKKEKK